MANSATKNKKKGFVLLWRSSFDNDVINDDREPFDKRSAWFYLTAVANHENNTFVYNGKDITINKGQHHTSIAKLAKRWHWSENRVRRYLVILERHHMIETERTTNGTTITIVNYGIYNNVRQTNGTTNGSTVGTTNGSTGGRQTNNEEQYIRNNEEIKRPAPLINAWGEVVEE